MEWSKPLGDVPDREDVDQFEDMRFSLPIE
jgi:hypothetical protein